MYPAAYHHHPNYKAGRTHPEFLGIAMHEHRPAAAPYGNAVSPAKFTTPSGVGDYIQSQNVRGVQDSLRTQQANCIDGSVLFASILPKLGIDPIIVLIPGHAFLGFYTDAQHKGAAFLETTMPNPKANPHRTGRPDPLNDGIAHFIGKDVMQQQAIASFKEALNVGSARYKQAKAAIDAHKPRYRIVDIAKQREHGIQPIGL